MSTPPCHKAPDHTWHILDRCDSCGFIRKSEAIGLLKLGIERLRNLSLSLGDQNQESGMRRKIAVLADELMKAETLEQFQMIFREDRHTASEQVTAEQEAIRRYHAGERLCFSSGIDEGLTYGYGDLDAHGFWQFPLPYEHLRPEHKMLADQYAPGSAKPRPEEPPTKCKHDRRRPYTPMSSVGDESDYVSKCIRCGRLSRDQPTD